MDNPLRRLPLTPPPQHTQVTLGGIGLASCSNFILVCWVDTGGFENTQHKAKSWNGTTSGSSATPHNILPDGSKVCRALCLSLFSWNIGHSKHLSLPALLWKLTESLKGKELGKPLNTQLMLGPVCCQQSPMDLVWATGVQIRSSHLPALSGGSDWRSFLGPQQ